MSLQIKVTLAGTLEANDTLYVIEELPTNYDDFSWLVTEGQVLDFMEQHGTDQRYAIVALGLEPKERRERD
jgi:hypothetical protein